MTYQNRFSGVSDSIHVTNRFPIDLLWCDLGNDIAGGDIGDDLLFG